MVTCMAWESVIVDIHLYTSSLELSVASQLASA